MDSMHRREEKEAFSLSTSSHESAASGRAARRGPLPPPPPRALAALTIVRFYLLHRRFCSPADVKYAGQWIIIVI